MRTLLARARALDPRWADALLALAFAVEVTLELVIALPARHPDLGLLVAGMVLMSICLAVRRRLPLTALIGGLVVFDLVNALPPQYLDHLVSPLFVMLFIIYSAGRRLGDREVVVALVIATALLATGSAIDHYDDSLPNVLTNVGFAGWAPLLIGRFMRHRAGLHRTLREKAAVLEAQRAERAQAAAADERTRIAGELHDVVAHALSAMVVQAGGARRMAETDPGQAAAAFAAVETTGREALTEIRALLGVLRREDEEIALAPQPSLRHVAALVDRARAAGLPTSLEIEGEARDLPAGVDLTAYRVVQEALRGAAEQGAAGAAEVRLRYADDYVVLRIDDDGGAPLRDLPGIRERVGLYGGRLRAGARTHGGHTVRARLPVEAAP
jgi:signal transduction histidine kinase